MKPVLTNETSIVVALVGCAMDCIARKLSLDGWFVVFCF